MVYFPPVKPVSQEPFKCRGCGKWYVVRAEMALTSCTVLHGPGSCCHFSEREVESPATTEEEKP